MGTNLLCKEFLPLVNLNIVFHRVLKFHAKDEIIQIKLLCCNITVIRDGGRRNLYWLRFILIE